MWLLKNNSKQLKCRPWQYNYLKYGGEDAQYNLACITRRKIQYIASSSIQEVKKTTECRILQVFPVQLKAASCLHAQSRAPVWAQETTGRLTQRKPYLRWLNNPFQLSGSSVGDLTYWYTFSKLRCSRTRNQPSSLRFRTTDQTQAYTFNITLAIKCIEFLI